MSEVPLYTTVNFGSERAWADHIGAPNRPIGQIELRGSSHESATLCRRRTHRGGVLALSNADSRERIFIELMTSDCKLKAFREGSKRRICGT
jgi:hypothetical protein